MPPRFYEPAASATVLSHADVSFGVLVVEESPELNGDERVKARCQFQIGIDELHNSDGHQFVPTLTS